MTRDKAARTVDACEAIIAKVIHATNLDRVFFGDREEARQYLRMVVLENEEALGEASPKLRWVVLYRRALDEIYRQQAQHRVSCEGASARPLRPGALREDLLDAPGEPPPTPEQLAEAREALDAADRVFTALAPRERRILDDYSRGVSSNVTAGRLGISGQRVRQIVGRVLHRIRTKL